MSHDIAACPLTYEHGSTHYATRKSREASHIRGCRAKGEPTCGGSFRCSRCLKLVGWCRGGCEGSIRDNWCEVCWAKPMVNESTPTTEKHGT